LSIRTTTARSLAAILLLAWGSGSGGLATELPAYMLPIAGAVTTSPAEVANDNVLALNTSMFQLYGDASKVFQRNILAQHPVILGLCPLSDDLRHTAGFRKGGSGSSVIEIMRHAVDAASDGLRLSGA
jgi:hypothetical protein